MIPINWKGTVRRDIAHLALVILGKPFADDTADLKEGASFQLMRSRVLRVLARVGLEEGSEDAIAVEISDPSPATEERVDRLIKACRENHRLTKGPPLAYAYHHAQTTANQLARPHRWLIVGPEEDDVPRRV